MKSSDTTTIASEAPLVPNGLRRLTRNLLTRRVREEAKLEAPPGEVWRWMTDFESFPSWNPFFRKVDGTLDIGETLKVCARLGKRVITFRPLITSADPGRELRWTTRVLVPGLFDVDRRFTLDTAGDQQTTLIQDETSCGLLVPLAFALAHMERDLRAGFRDFSQALALQTAAARARAPARSDVRALQRGRADGGADVGADAGDEAGGVARNKAVQH